MFKNFGTLLEIDYSTVFFFFFLFFFFFGHGLACGILEPVPHPSPALKAQSSNPWSTSKVPEVDFKQETF